MPEAERKALLYGDWDSYSGQNITTVTASGIANILQNGIASLAVQNATSLVNSLMPSVLKA